MVTGTEQAARLPAELRHAEELARLAANDPFPRPEGWRLSPRAVRRFIIGDPALGIERKFYGDDPLVDRAIVSLMGHQGLLLVGEPGTAKSLLSELLAAAISGDSGLTVQGTAGTSEDHLKYSWNYALLLAEGPSPRALVPSPVYQAMASGRLVRVEEITRCAPEIQDVLISLLSDKQLIVPELGESGRLMARRGFNVIGTANLRDRGVHEMSAALKRRFNFETVLPLRDSEFETTLVLQRVERELAASGEQVSIERDVIGLLTTTFAELRAGSTREGTPIKGLSAVMSTAEAVNVAYAAALQAAHFGDGRLGPAELVQQLKGVALKDDPEDLRLLRHYFDSVTRERARHGGLWKRFFDATRQLWSS